MTATTSSTNLPDKNEENVRLIWSTPNAEKLIGYCARVSSPENQEKSYDSPEKLLAYCISNSHWSIFEMADMCVEIRTSRAISAQLIRHKSFSFQEFSQRYAKVNTCEKYVSRRQDTKNRQNSIDDLSPETNEWFSKIQEENWNNSKKLYETCLEKGIAKECARFLLPMSSTTTIYMKGSVRSWIHYLQVRCGNGTQKEHFDIANKIKKIFKEQFPIIASACNF